MSDGVLLIGADGFVGSAVLEAAARYGVDMLAASRRAGAGDGRRFVDVLRPETFAPAMEGVATVIHAAGAAHMFRRTKAAGNLLHRTNVEGTRNVVVAAREAGVRHVVLVSSVSVYGDASDSYPRSKAEAERAATEAAQDAVKITTLRLATVYGEGDPGNVLRLVRAIDRRRFIWIGRGENRKSLIHRADAGAAIVTAAMATSGGVFDVSAPPVTMRDVVTTIASALDRWVPRLPISNRAANFAAHALTLLTLHNRRSATIERMISKWCADDVYDGSRFCARFGFTPEVSLADGLGREVAWYLAAKAAPSSGRHRLPPAGLDAHGK
jgi:nucleoside-diphosphate-sugar epimerase